MRKRYLHMNIIILILVIVDQIIKYFMVNNKNKVLPNFVENFGGAFGIGANSTIFFILVNIVVLGIIIKFIYSQKDRIDKKTLCSFTLILAGGISNLIDRITRGYVVDYIDVTNIFKFPLFNIADICVVVGCIMLFICITIYWCKEVKVTKNNKEERA